MGRPQSIQFFSLCAEFIISITALALFLANYAQDQRTRLWEVGGEKGWNSDPRLRIYFYANHREPPEIPLVWSQKYVSLPFSGSWAPTAVIRRGLS